MTCGSACYFGVEIFGMGHCSKNGQSFTLACTKAACFFFCLYYSYVRMSFYCFSKERLLLYNNCGCLVEYFAGLLLLHFRYSLQEACVLV